MLAKRVLFVGVGAAGGNITNELQKKGYFTYYVNTNKDDLDSLEGISKDIKFKVPMAKGCNRDRKKALEYTKEYHEMIVDEIENKFDFMDFIFFVFSSGGGTGSGVSPVLLDIMSRRNPDKHLGAICVLPKMDDDNSTKKNSIQCLMQLYSRPYLKNVYLLDNNHRKDEFVINEVFADYMDKLLNITTTNVRGIIDEAETERLLSTRGNVIISELDGFNKSIEQSIFAKYERGNQYIAVSSNNDEINKADIESKLGIPEAWLRGYNDTGNNIVASFGMKFATYRLDRFEEALEETKTEVVESVEVDKTYSIPTSDKTLKKESKKPKTKEIDFESLWAEFE